MQDTWAGLNEADLSKNNELLVYDISDGITKKVNFVQGTGIIRGTHTFTDGTNKLLNILKIKAPSDTYIIHPFTITMSAVMYIGNDIKFTHQFYRYLGFNGLTINPSMSNKRAYFEWQCFNERFASDNNYKNSIWMKWPETGNDANYIFVGIRGANTRYILDFSILINGLTEEDFLDVRESSTTDYFSDGNAKQVGDSSNPVYWGPEGPTVCNSARLVISDGYLPAQPEQGVVYVC